MTWGRVPLALGLVAAACAGPPAAARVAAAGASPAAGLPLRVVFAPPLLAPARFELAHECGLELAGIAAPTGVALALPPGPAVLRLHAGGRVEELAVVVRAGAAEVVWELPPAGEVPDHAGAALAPADRRR